LLSRWAKVPAMLHYSVTNVARVQTGRRAGVSFCSTPIPPEKT
jgi:hypothetical protein